MEVRTQDKKQIEEIISGMKCQKDFECYKSGFKNLIKVKIFEEENLIECLGKFPEQCDFSFPFADGYFCKCLLRAYIAKHLKK